MQPGQDQSGRQPPNKSRLSRRISLGGAGAAAVIAVLVLNFWVARNDSYDGVFVARIWAACSVLIIAFMITVGLAINDRPAGLIIDNRNRVSLSKFQAAAWTVLIVSALATAVAARIGNGAIDPVAITIYPELLAALGIASTSLVATPAILSLKAEGVDAPPQQVQDTANRLGMDPKHVDSTGRVFGRTDPSVAEWLDMFRGEDVSNAAAPDLSKIQQFLLSVLVIAVYAAALLDMFLQGKMLGGAGGSEASLPPLSAQFVWLMGISHASYLAYKAVPHGPPPPSDDDAVG